MSNVPSPTKEQVERQAYWDNWVQTHPDPEEA